MRSAFPGSDDITRVELSNGITILNRFHEGSQTLVINGYLLAGSLFDPQEQLGLAGFTASALMRGTSRRNFQEIYESLESVGAGLRFSSGVHTTTFIAQALVEDAPMLLELFAEVLRFPAFPPDQLDRLRNQLLTGLAIHAQDTAYMAQITFDQLVYPEHPYGRPEEGVPETIRTISIDTLADFHQRIYGPRGMVIALAGGVDPASFLDDVTRALGDWTNPVQPEPPPLPPVRPLNEQVIRRVTIPGKFQSDLVMGVAGPPRCAPDFVAANLGNSILGQFGMMGRIGEVVREEAGLAYYVQSNLSGGLGPGPWDISAGVDPENLERVIDLIQAELRHFVSEPVSAEELADVQAYFSGSLPLTFESNYGVASALVNLERYQLGLDYYRNYASMIQAVTREDVLQAARAYLDPQRLAIAIAGP